MKREPALILTAASIAASVALAAVLLVVYFTQGSLLALGQAADSLSDCLVGGILLFAVVVASRPPDKDHHFGHSQAQPIAALIAAVCAALLGAAVIREAIGAVVTHHTARLGAFAAATFAAKVGIKLAIAVLAIVARRRDRSPALHALAVDAMADVGVGAVALAGYAGVHLGYDSLDAWLAIPIGLYVMGAAASLARDNVKLLMGAAPPPERQAEIEAVIRDTPGVDGFDDLRMRENGAGVEVAVCVFVDPELSVGGAHRIADRVEGALEEGGEVTHAIVHIHPRPRKDD